MFSMTPIDKVGGGQPQSIIAILIGLILGRK